MIVARIRIQIFFEITMDVQIEWNTCTRFRIIEHEHIKVIAIWTMYRLKFMWVHVWTMYVSTRAEHEFYLVVEIVAIVAVEEN